MAHFLCHAPTYIVTRYIFLEEKSLEKKLCFEKVNPHLTVLLRTIYDTNLSIKEDREHKQTEIHKKKGERP